MLEPRQSIFLAGLLIALVIGIGGIVYMFKEKVIYDKEGNKIEVEVPVFGKLSTNYPAIGAFFISATLVAFIISQWMSVPDTEIISTSVDIEDVRSITSPTLVLGVIPQTALKLQTLRPT